MGRIKSRVTITIDPAVLALAEKTAKAHGWALSSYFEGAVVWDQISDGNVQAMKIATERIMAKVKERFQGYVDAEGESVKG